MGGGGSEDEEVIFNVDMLTQRIMEDGQLYDTKVREALTRLKQDKYDLPDVLQGYSSSGHYPLMNYFNFSTWYNKYAFPQVLLQSVNVPTEQIHGIIASKHNVPTSAIVNLQIMWGTPVELDWIQYRLQELYNYSIDDNEMIYDTVTYSVQGYTIVTNNNVSHIEVQIEYVQTEIPKPEVLPTIIVPFVPNNYAYIATYYIEEKIMVGETEETKYILKKWIYYPLLGTNTNIGQTNIPSLLAPLSGQTSFDTYPITLLRHNYFSLDEYDQHVKVLPAGDKDYTVYRPDSITLDHYKDTDYTVNSLGLTLDTLIESINENPSVQDISDVFILCGIDPNDTHVVTSKMLFLTFEHIATLDDIYRPEYTVTPPIKPEEPPYNASQEDLDRYEEALEQYNKEYQNYIDNLLGFNGDYSKTITINRDPFNLALEWSYVTRDVEFGVIGDEGTYLHTITQETGIVSGGITGPTTEEQTVLTIKEQTTEDTVTTIRVQRLNGVTIIGRSYQGSLSASASSAKLIIPIPVEVMDKMTPVEKIEVMERTLRLVFYAAKLHIEKLAWYETGIFKTILQILAAIITIVVNFVPAIGQGLSAALAATFKSVFIGISIMLAIKLISTIVDIPFIEQILSVITIVVGAYLGYVDLSKLSDMVLTAVQLANIALDVATGIIQLDLQDTLKEAEEFRNKYDSTIEELTKIKEDLSQGLTTEGLVNMASKEIVVLIPPEHYYGMQFDLLNNFDLLFNSTYDSVNTFYNNSYKLA